MKRVLQVSFKIKSEDPHEHLKTSNGSFLGLDLSTLAKKCPENVARLTVSIVLYILRSANKKFSKYQNRKKLTGFVSF
jgi:hypothetical protein